jgi:hypothetical protein
MILAAGQEAIPVLFLSAGLGAAKRPEARQTSSAFQEVWSMSG